MFIGTGKVSQIISAPFLWARPPPLANRPPLSLTHRRSPWLSPLSQKLQSARFVSQYMPVVSLALMDRHICGRNALRIAANDPFATLLLK